MKKNHPHRKKLLENIPDRLYTESELNSSEWLGAILRYIWHLGKRNFNSFYSQKELIKNKRVGRWFKAFLIIILILFGYLSFLWIY